MRRGVIQAFLVLVGVQLVFVVLPQVFLGYLVAPDGPGTSSASSEISLPILLLVYDGGYATSVLIIATMIGLSVPLRVLTFGDSAAIMPMGQALRQAVRHLWQVLVVLVCLAALIHWGRLLWYIPYLLVPYFFSLAPYRAAFGDSAGTALRKGAGMALRHRKLALVTAGAVIVFAALHQGGQAVYSYLCVVSPAWVSTSFHAVAELALSFSLALLWFFTASAAMYVDAREHAKAST
jgi:hypothetical protein